MSRLRYQTSAAAYFEAARQISDPHLDARWQALHGHSFAVQARTQANAACPPARSADQLQQRLRALTQRWDYAALNTHLDRPTDATLARSLLDSLPATVEAVRLRSAPGHGLIVHRQQPALIWRSYRFESAHRLPHVPPGHKCGRMHGHGFVARIFVQATDMPAYAALDAAWAKVETLVQRRCLNHIPGLENPTSENMAAWIWAQLLPSLPTLAAVCVHETASCGAHFDGQHYRIWKTLTLDSATADKGAGPDPQRYGHTYTLRLHLQAPLDAHYGWGVDFGDVKAAFQPLFLHLDHQPLDALSGLQQTDTAGIAAWIQAESRARLPLLERIDLYQTPGCGSILSWGSEPALASL